MQRSFCNRRLAGGGAVLADFLAVAQGPMFFLAETCQSVHFSTPFFLAAQRRVVSSRQEEVAFFDCADAHETKGPAGPFEILEELGLSCVLIGGAHKYLSTLVLAYRQFLFAAFLHKLRAEQQILSLEPAKSKFPLEISLRWLLRWCSEVSLSSTAPHPRRRVQSKALCAADGTENLPLGSPIAEYRLKPVKPYKQERECLQNP